MCIWILWACKKADPEEIAANEFARNTLIPHEYYAQLHGDLTAKAIKDFARAVGTTPGIVVGRLQFDGRLTSPRQFSYLKQRFDWVKAARR
jgi:HTH-type transcriptional regulator/antitoxin HigA